MSETTREYRVEADGQDVGRTHDYMEAVQWATEWLRLGYTVAVRPV